MKSVLVLTTLLISFSQTACKLGNSESSDTKSNDSQEMLAASLAICSEAPGSAKRQQALNKFNAYVFGTRAMNVPGLAKSQEACVTQLLPSAIYTSMRSGIPVSSMLAQAVQETGWCKSKLAQTGYNFHGQKAKFAVSNFKYWDGAAIDISSSESTTGSGSNVVSSFMKFKHPDFSFYSVAERQTMKGLPYRECARYRLNTSQYIDCFAKSWAVHATYGQHLKDHIASFSFSGTKLGRCDLKQSEWKLDEKFKGLPVDPI